MDTDAKKILKIALLSIFFLFIVGYGFSRSTGLIFGVKIKDVSLVDGATIAENTVQVTGNAKNAIHLSLNGREISIDQAGNFEETVALLSGYNIVSIRAEDKFGHVDEKVFRLIGGFAGEAKLQVTD